MTQPSQDAGSLARGCHRSDVAVPRFGDSVLRATLACWFSWLTGWPHTAAVSPMLALMQGGGFVDDSITCDIRVQLWLPSDHHRSQDVWRPCAAGPSSPRYAKRELGSAHNGFAPHRLPASCEGAASADNGQGYRTLSLHVYGGATTTRSCGHRHATVQDTTVPFSTSATASRAHQCRSHLETATTS